MVKTYKFRLLAFTEYDFKMLVPTSPLILLNRALYKLSIIWVNFKYKLFLLILWDGTTGI